MSNKLQIYACSGVEDNKRVGFVLEDTNTATNTQAMNTLLTYMNLYATEIRCLKYLTDDEKAERFNKLDIFALSFYYARLYRQDKAALRDVGIVMSKLLADGKLWLDSADAKEHEAHVDDMIAVIDDMVATGEYTEPDESEFWDWWKERVVEASQEGLNKEQQEALISAEAQAQKIGATVKEDYGDLNKYLYDGGTYFIYLYVAEDKLKDLTYVMRKKRRKQQEVYDYCRKCFTSIYGSEEAMQRVIRSGIIEDFGIQPEEVIESIFNGTIKDKSIGNIPVVPVPEPVTLSVQVIVAIILAIAFIIATLIVALCDYGAKVAVAKYTVPESPEDAVIDESDWGGLKVKSNGVDSNVVMIGLAAVAAFFLLKDK